MNKLKEFIKENPLLWIVLIIVFLMVYLSQDFYIGCTG